MSVKTGKFALVNGFPSNRNWSFSRTSTPKPYIASNTQGATGRVPGNVDCTGSIGSYGHTPPTMPGETFSFQGFTAPVSGSNGPVYTIPAIVDSFALALNWDNADPVSYTLNFGCTGAVVESSSTFTDVTAPVVHSLIGEGLTVQVGSGWEEICGVTSIAWTLTAANKTYNNSCTDGATGRAEGTLDWTLSINVQEISLAALPFDIGDLVAFRLPVGGGLYWQLLWGIVSGFNNINANRETGDIISMTINAEMAGFDVTGATGQIIKPNGDLYWGEE